MFSMLNTYFDSITAALKGGCESTQKNAYSLPVVTLSISFISLCIGIMNAQTGLLEWLCFDYLAITEQQQYWRLITGHLIHSSFEHLFWDLLAFAACSFYLERRNHGVYWLTIAFSIICLDLFLLSPLTNIAQYSGLSGVLYAVATVAAWQWKRDYRGMLAWTPLLVIVLKTVLEVVQKEAVFVSEGWTLLGEAHLVGLGAGVMSLFLCSRFSYGVLYKTKQP